MYTYVVQVINCCEAPDTSSSYCEAPDTSHIVKPLILLPHIVKTLILLILCIILLRVILHSCVVSLAVMPLNKLLCAKMYWLVSLFIGAVYNYV